MTVDEVRALDDFLDRDAYQVGTDYELTEEEQAAYDSLLEQGIF